MGLPSLATMAVAWMLHAMPMQTAAGVEPVEPDASQVVRVAEAEARWYAALDAAQWDRDAPSARAAGDGITTELIPLLSRNDEAGQGAIRLAGEIAAVALGPWLRAQAPPSLYLTRAYLAYHDDPALLAALAAAGSAPVYAGDLAALARAHRASVGAALASAYPSLPGGYPRGGLCDAALALPRAARSLVARSVVASWRADAPDDLAVGCVVLGAELREGRARIASWLRRLEPGAGASSLQMFPMWTGIGLLALAGSEQAAFAAATVTRLFGETDDSLARVYFLATLTDPLASVAGWLPLATPVGRRVLAGLASLDYVERSWIGLARIRAGDPALAERAMEVLRNPNLGGAQLETALGLAGLDAGRSIGGAREVHERLVSLGAQLRAQRHDEPPRQEIDAWIAAVDRVAACSARRACLVELLDTGSDDAAARAIRVLGARGLASLRPAEAQPLLRRLLIAPAPWLVAAFFVTVEGCPSTLRGAREIDAPADTYGAGSFVRAFRRACAEVTR